MKRKFTITLDMPEDILVSEMATYIKDAVSGWKNSYHKENPIFSLNADSIKVVTVPKKRVKRKEAKEEKKV